MQVDGDSGMWCVLSWRMALVIASELNHKKSDMLSGQISHISNTFIMQTIEFMCEEDRLRLRIQIISRMLCKLVVVL